MISREAYLRVVRGQSAGIGGRLARGGLSILEAIYRPVIVGRNVAFDRGWKKVNRASVPVISVGNLTLGGTGKTPMVEWAARWFRERGVRVALLSRGYGSTGGLNDEGMVLDQNLPDVPHLQSADRCRLAEIAVEELEAELLILDDGYQHRRLGRDLDLVLLDAMEPFGLGRLFPRGLLREPMEGIRRADVVVLSRADLVDEGRRVEIRAEAERAARRELRWAEVRQAPMDLLDFKGNAYALADLAGEEVVAFCGIGNPEGFRRTLERMGVEVRDFRIFPDHHSYTRSDAVELTEWSRSAGARVALTTQKDLVKLPLQNFGSVPLRAVRIGVEVTSGEDALAERFEALLRGMRGEER